jgi:thiamine kinase-like enzyme
MTRIVATLESGTALGRALALWAGWDLPLTGQPEILQEIKGGRTNRNFRLAAPGLGGDLLLRINHPDPVRLGIDRTLEREILRLTSAAGISRPALYWDPDHRYVVFPWVEARSWTPEDLACPKQRARLWPLIRRLRDIVAPRRRRSYLAYLQHYWDQLEKLGPIDRGLEERWRYFRPRLQAFDEAPWQEKLVHHDLVPANILDTGQRLYLIDWEYAAPGHPDIDTWYLEPERIEEPFILELIGWINTLWERLTQDNGQ